MSDDKDLYYLRWQRSSANREKISEEKKSGETWNKKESYQTYHGYVRAGGMLFMEGSEIVRFLKRCRPPWLGVEEMFGPTLPS